MAGWLLLGNAFWVLAYDTEYAMVDRQDDLRIGIKTSAITLGRWDVPAIICFYILYLTIWCGVLWSRISIFALLVALLICGAQVIWHATLIRTRSPEGCFKAFRLNHWLGFVLFASIVFSSNVRLT
jgi:4-hydroxybenzoate polyprenyltransferase